jgi:hypothetical protein
MSAFRESSRAAGRGGNRAPEGLAQPGPVTDPGGGMVPGPVTVQTTA